MKWKPNHPRRTINTLCEAGKHTHIRRAVELWQVEGGVLWSLTVVPGDKVALEMVVKTKGRKEIRDGKQVMIWSGPGEQRFSISGKHDFEG